MSENRQADLTGMKAVDETAEETVEETVETLFNILWVSSVKNHDIYIFKSILE